MSDWQSAALARLNEAMLEEKSHPKSDQLSLVLVEDKSVGYQPYRAEQITLTEEYQLLKKKNLIESNKPATKKQKKGKCEPSTPERITYLERVKYGNHEVAAFPFGYWTSVFQARTRDILKALHITSKDTVYSHEGFKFYIKAKITYAESQITDHLDVSRYGRTIQKIVGGYFPQNTSEYLDMWIVSRDARVESTGRLTLGIKFHFKNLIVSLGMARQLLESIREKLKELPGNNVELPSHFDGDFICTRSIYTSKILSCPDCSKPTDTPTICDTCMNYTYIISPYVYTPRMFLTHTGQVRPFNFDPDTLGDVLRQCSLVPPSDLAEYTPGYSVPGPAPVYIPVQLRSRNTKDSGLTCVYKVDRASLGKMKQTGAQVVDLRRLDLIVKEIQRYHLAYREAKLSSVTQTRTCFFVDLSSGGRSFCRIATREGKTHNSNRVYFRITVNSITQHCYDPECKSILKADQNLKNSLSQSLVHGARLFYDCSGRI
jgi:hypothetical protein